MGLNVSESVKADFEPIEQGVHVAVCYAVVDIGRQYSEMYGRATEKVIFSWELPGLTVEMDGKEERRVISKTFTTSLHPKSALRKTLEAWRGRGFTKDELNGFHLKNLIGAPCMLQINHIEKNGKVFADIASVVTLLKTLEKPRLEREALLYDHDNPNPEVFNKLPKWMQERIDAAIKTKDDIVAGGVIDNDDDLPF